MPNQANGYSTKLSVRWSAGMDLRQIPPEPSAPTTTSAWISWASPSESVTRIFGVSVSRSTSSVAVTEYRTSPPSRSRAAARSTNTSFCG